MLDRCAANATHIVVVTEGDKIDGIVEVLEFLEGRLKKGEILTIPELAEFASAEARKVQKNYYALGEDQDATRPEFVRGSRMVLFLIWEPKSDTELNSMPPWRPANDLDRKVRVSVAWVEQGKIYAFSPLELLYQCMTEKEMKERVDKIVANQPTDSGANQEGVSAKLLQGNQRKCLRRCLLQPELPS